MSQNRLPCHFPWTNVYVSPNGDVRHCCSTDHKAIGNLAVQALSDIWNNATFREVRRYVAAGEFHKARCNPNCEGLRNGRGFPFPEHTRGGAELQANEQRAEESFATGAESVDHLPTQLKVEFTDNCNFRCVMCFYDFVPPYRMVPERAVEQIRDMSKLATHVVLMGGEVFVNRFDLEFIKTFEPAPGASMGFVTNASVLDDEKLRLLRKFKRMGMQISIDGATEDVFEKIRVRGKWQVVDANIRRVVAAASALSAEGYEWNIHLAYVVMRSNLADLSNAVRYAIDLGVPIRFGPVKGFHLFDENVFVYRRPLESVPDWRRHVAEALEVLDGHRESYRHYGVVKADLEEIQRYLGARKVSLSPIFVRGLRKLLRNEKDVGHLIAAYHAWRVEGAPLLDTVSHVGNKLWQRVHGRLRRWHSRSRAARKATPSPNAG